MTEPPAEPIVQSARQQAIGEFARFAVIGVVGFIVDYSTLKLLVMLFNIDLYSGRLLSFLTAATGNWMLNRRFTFKQTRKESRFRQWLKYLGANGVGFAVNYSTYAALITYVPIAKIHFVLALAAGSIAGLSFNFTANKLWVFRAHPQGPL
jgi:putative flippase GtrA